MCSQHCVLLYIGLQGVLTIHCRGTLITLDLQTENKQTRVNSWNIIIIRERVAQWMKHMTHDPKIVGLNPAATNVVFLGKALYRYCHSPPRCKMGTCLEYRPLSTTQRYKYALGIVRQLAHSVGSGKEI